MSRQLKGLRRITACLLIALVLVGTVSVTNTEAALKKTGNCRFTRWNNKSFTACRISWDKVSGAGYYEIDWRYMDGTHIQRKYQYGKYNVLDINGLSNTHVYRAQVRALKVNSKGKITGYGAWSNTAYIVPTPRSVSMKLKDSSKVKLSWDRIHGSRGYNVYMTTNPTGKWYLVKTTDKKSSATSATISKYRGSALKKQTNYYIRIVPRVKYGGKYRDVYVKSGYYQGGFVLRTVTK